jgi:hypothetical protein
MRLGRNSAKQVCCCPCSVVLLDPAMWMAKLNPPLLTCYALCTYGEHSVATWVLGTETGGDPSGEYPREKAFDIPSACQLRRSAYLG